MVTHSSFTFLSFRYQVIENPLPSQKVTSFWRKCFVIGSCWLYALFWSIFPLLGWSSYGMEGIGISCSIRWQSRDAGNISYTVLLFMFAFVIPMAVICFAYFKTYEKVRCHNRSVTKSMRHIGTRNEVSIQVQGHSREHSENMGQRKSQQVVFKEIRIAKMGFIMASAFCLAWIPYAVASIVAVCSPSSVSPLAATVPAIIAKSSTCYFPIIYGITHTTFRKEITKMAIRVREKNRADFD